MGSVSITVHEAINLVGLNADGTSDLYVRVRFANLSAKSKVIQRVFHPKWNVKFTFGLPRHEQLTDPKTNVQISVWHYQRGDKDVFLGYICIPFTQIPFDQLGVKLWHELHRRTKKDHVSGLICCTIGRMEQVQVASALVDVAQVDDDGIELPQDERYQLPARGARSLSQDEIERLTKDFGSGMYMQGHDGAEQGPPSPSPAGLRTVSSTLVASSTLHQSPSISVLPPPGTPPQTPPASAPSLVEYCRGPTRSDAHESLGSPRAGDSPMRGKPPRTQESKSQDALFVTDDDIDYTQATTSVPTFSSSSSRSSMASRRTVWQPQTAPAVSIAPNTKVPTPRGSARSSLASGGGKGTGDIHLFSGSRETKIRVALRQLGMEWNKAKQAIVRLDSEVLTAGQILMLMQCALPTPDEVETLKSYKGDISSLCPEDRALLEMMMIPSSELRLQLLLDQVTHRESVAVAKRNCRTLTQACDEAVHSEDLAQILRIAMSHFQQLVAASEDPQSVGLEPLIEFLDTEVAIGANQGNIVPFISYLVSHIASTNGHLLATGDSLVAIDAAEELSIRDVVNEITELSERAQREKLARQELLSRQTTSATSLSTLQRELEAFDRKVEDNLRDLGGMLESLHEVYRELAGYLGDADDGSTEDIEDCDGAAFDLLRRLVIRYRQAVAQYRSS
eukprot:Rmarinus@m.28909